MLFFSSPENLCFTSIYLILPRNYVFLYYEYQSPKLLFTITEENHQKLSNILFSIF